MIIFDLLRQSQAEDNKPSAFGRQPNGWRALKIRFDLSYSLSFYSFILFAL